MSVVFLATLLFQPPRELNPLLQHYEVRLRETFELSLYRSYKVISFDEKREQDFILFSQELLKENRVQGSEETAVMLGIAEAYFRVNEKGKALKYLERLFEKSPQEVARINYLLQYFGLNREAIKNYEEYQSLMNDEALFARELSYLYEKEGDYQKATIEAMKSIQRWPRLLDHYQRAILSYLERTEPERIIKAVKRTKKSKERSQVLSRIYLSLGRLHEARKEFERIEEPSELLKFAEMCEESRAFQLALELFQELDRPVEQARILKKMGRIDEAMEILKQEDSREGMFEYAELLRTEKGDCDEARELYRRVLKYKKDALHGLLECQIVQGELDKAWDVLKKAKESEKILFYRIEVSFYRNEFDTCSYYINELVKQFPENPVVNDALEISLLLQEEADLRNYTRAALLCRMKRYEEGIEQTQKVISQGTPLADNAYLLLGRLYRLNRQPYVALKAYEELGEKFPGSSLLPNAHLEQARIYFEDLKDKQKAKETVENLILIYPASPASYIARNMLNEIMR